MVVVAGKAREPDNEQASGEDGKGRCLGNTHVRSVWQQSESTPRLNGQQALKSRQLESRSSPTSLKVCYFILSDCWSCSGEFCREKEGENVVSRDGCLVCVVDDPSCSQTETDQLDAQMPFVKTVKSNAYFSRFQVKYRRRREGKTDCKQPNSPPKNRTQNIPRLRSQAPDYPGKEQIQRTQVPLGRPLHEQAGHCADCVRSPPG